MDPTRNIHLHHSPLGASNHFSLGRSSPAQGAHHAISISRGRASRRPRGPGDHCKFMVPKVPSMWKMHIIWNKHVCFPLGDSMGCHLSWCFGASYLMTIRLLSEAIKSLFRHWVFPTINHFQTLAGRFFFWMIFVDPLKCILSVFIRFPCFAVKLSIKMPLFSGGSWETFGPRALRGAGRRGLGGYPITSKDGNDDLMLVSGYPIKGWLKTH